MMMFQINDCRTSNTRINVGVAGARDLDDLKALVSAIEEETGEHVWLNMVNDILSIGDHVCDKYVEDEDEDDCDDCDEDCWNCSRLPNCCCRDDDDEYYDDEEDDERPGIYHFAGRVIYR